MFRAHAQTVNWRSFAFVEVFSLYLAFALERYLTRTLSTIDVRVDAAADLRAEMWGSLTRMDRLLIRKDGTMRVKDEHLNIVARWLYPVAVAC